MKLGQLQGHAGPRELRRNQANVHAHELGVHHQQCSVFNGNGSQFDSKSNLYLPAKTMNPWNTFHVVSILAMVRRIK